MTGKPIEVKISANWDRWAHGFGDLALSMGTAGRVAWRAATEVMFDRSQAYAHVLTGDMKSSGSFEVDVEGPSLVGRIEYDSDHAIYEEARGGEHAYIGRAWEATEAVFAEAMPAAWAAVVRSWS